MADGWVRPLGATVSGRFRDPHNLVEPRIFTFALNYGIHHATRLGYFLSLLCLTPDLPPSKGTSALIRRAARLSIGRLRAADLAASFVPHCVRILLIDAETRNLPGIIQRIQDGLDPVGRLTLSVGGACYPQTAGSADELLRQAMGSMALARAEGGNRLYLPS